jgi:hypothetical protein
MNKDKKILWNYQIYILIWMELWKDYRDEILDNKIGLGKISFYEY